LNAMKKMIARAQLPSFFLAYLASSSSWTFWTTYAVNGACGNSAQRRALNIQYLRIVVTNAHDATCAGKQRTGDLRLCPSHTRYLDCAWCQRMRAA